MSWRVVTLGDRRRILVGEPARVPSHRGLEHDARPQRFPRIGAALREENLTDPTRRELAAGMADHADAHDGDVELLAVDLW